MKKDMPLEGLRWSRDSGSALYDTPQTAVLGRAGGGKLQIVSKKMMGDRNNQPPTIKKHSHFLLRYLQMQASISMSSKLFSQALIALSSSASSTSVISTSTSLSASSLKYSMVFLLKPAK